ncbi:MAG: restriction endonuclease subunit S [Bacteroidota bacterium]|nr:restriction endonuclease subunit S [Bacteroidota bacterium]
MKLDKLGNIIQDIDLKNKSGKLNCVLGVNIFKRFMPSVANLTNTDLTKYKVISKNQFATNIMHVDRDERLPIALYNDENPALVSPAYKVFEIKKGVEILPEYLMINFLRPEFDRYSWYLCDSSVRGGLEWSRFKEIQIPIIPLVEQQKFVVLYKALLQNQAVYQNSLEDLQLICDSYIETLIKTEPKKRLGEYIEQVDNRNSDLKVKLAQGVSVDLEFITPKRIAENIANGKIVKKGEFAYNKVMKSEGTKLPIALRRGEDCVISSSYEVFKIKNNEVLLSEFLMLFLSRKETQRYAGYISWGTTRDIFSFDELSELMLPIPDIEKQQAIVTIYRTLETRKKLNEKLKESLQPLCPILMAGVREKGEKV